MKKLFIALTAMILGISTQAQRLKVYKDGTLVQIIKSPEGNKFVFEDYEYVDLGLPSGTLWATCNVGAESPEDFGDYFAWGETKPQSKNTYNWPSYKWMSSAYNSSWPGCTKYTFADNQTYSVWYNSDGEYIGTTVNGVTYKNLTKLEAADDAATANWGSIWCMPTHAQQEELINSSYTTTTWTTLNGVYGRLITSKMTGYTDKSLFLPAAGCRYNYSLTDAGSYGFYWSSELYTDHTTADAWRLLFMSSSVKTSGDWRCEGFSVRPVRVSK